MPEPNSSAVLVIGVGNEFRSDDGAGIEALRGLRGHERIEVREIHGEPVGLLDACRGRDAILLLDTMRSGATPGTIRRLDLSHEPLPAHLKSSTSTHAVGLGETIELGRMLGALPARVVLYTVEGERFEAGRGLSPQVSAAIPRLVAMVLDEATSL